MFIRNIKTSPCPAAWGTCKYEQTSAFFEPCKGSKKSWKCCLLQIFGGALSYLCCDCPKLTAIVWFCLTSQSTAMIVSKLSVLSVTTLFFLGKFRISGYPDVSAHTFVCTCMQLTTALLKSVKEKEWTKKIVHSQTPQKYGAGLGSNSGPLDQQSHSLLTVLLFCFFNLQRIKMFGSTPKESSNAYTFVLAFSWKLEFQIKRYFGIH